jgi:DnaK suppressor protein
MPAKKAPAKSTKTRKASARPTARATSARKAPARIKSAAAVRSHVARSAAPARSAPARTPVASARVAPAKSAKPAATVRPAPEPIVASAIAMPSRGADLVPSPAPLRTAPGVAEHSEDVDGDGANSLLAGPRNVQPYVAKRGEQYMGKAQLEHFRSILLNWKQDLMLEVDRTVSHMKDEAANFPDPNDRATQEEEFSLELRTRDRERKLIRKIDDALKRIEDGSYGYCLETGEEIGIKRLEARPVATLSLEAQERRERRERQYGDRDDRYR